jgi:hypothetical protein
MKEIETRSTSLKTAECTPIVLRESEQVRLVFLPTLVDNAATPDACVRGHFVYQRKTRREEWVPVTNVPLSSLKSGEGFKLELHSQELLALIRGIGPLYRLYGQQGIPRGRTTFVRLEAGLARFLALGEPELTTFLDAHTDDAATTLLKLVKWLASSPQAGETASRIAAIAPEQLPGFTALLGLATLKNGLAYWKQHQTNSAEEFWQQALADRAYVLSQVFAYPLVVIGTKAYVGGKQVSNKGGNVIDFLAAIESTDAVVLIEIKTPQTKLLGRAYRENVFPLSPELSGAIAQVLGYRQSLMRDFYSVTAARPKQLTLGEPRCLIIAGHASNELTSRPMRESFEIQRERLQGVAIITYDELFRRLERLIVLLEGEND